MNEVCIVEVGSRRRTVESEEAAEHDDNEPFCNFMHDDLLSFESEPFQRQEAIPNPALAVQYD
jgi:hypothetical protein